MLTFTPWIKAMTGLTKRFGQNQTPFLAKTEEGMEVLRTDAKTAKDMGGSDLADYLTKCQNIWARETENQFIDPEKMGCLWI